MKVYARIYNSNLESKTPWLRLNKTTWKAILDQFGGKLYLPPWKQDISGKYRNVNGKQPYKCIDYGAPGYVGTVSLAWIK